MLIGARKVIKPPRISARGRTIIASEILTALDFPANNAANSDIRFKFNGTNLPSRTSFTAIWASCTNTSVTGYVTHCFWSHDVGVFQSNLYELGGHPYPANSAAVDGTGQTTNSGGGTGTTHYMEMAGLGGRDQISNPGTAVLTTKDATTWKRHALQATVVGSTVRHRYWPDIIGNSSNYFERTINTADLPSPSAPAFYWGTSDWRSGATGANTNDETPNGKLRGFVIVNDGGLTSTQIAAIAALDTNASVLSYLAGQSLSPWYVNMNPTPSDVTDKSSAGHNPAWANSLRPNSFNL